MEKPEDKSLGLSLIDTIKSLESADVISDLGEIALDSLLQDGFLKEIPIISSILAVGKTAIQIRERIFLHKVLSFLKNLDNRSELDREKEWKKIEDDKEYAKKVGEYLILLLDRFDSFEKPALLAKLYSSCLKGEIKYEQFMKLSTSLDRSNIVDINALLRLASTKDYRTDGEYQVICKNLMSCGFGESIVDLEALEGFIINKSREYFRILQNETYNSARYMFSDHPYIYKLTEDAHIFLRVILKENKKNNT